MQALGEVRDNCKSPYQWCFEPELNSQWHWEWRRKDRFESLLGFEIVSTIFWLNIWILEERQKIHLLNCWVHFVFHKWNAQITFKWNEDEQKLCKLVGKVSDEKALERGKFWGLSLGVLRYLLCIAKVKLNIYVDTSVIFLNLAFLLFPIWLGVP